MKLNLELILRCALIFFFFGSTVLTFGQQDRDAGNPLMADPTIFYYDGIYHLYGTGGKAGDKGFTAFTSKDLINWKFEGYVLKKGESFGTRGFWAPQVFRYQNKFYMAYTADEHIAIAVADNPLGPFRQDTLASIPSKTRMIDPFVFFDNGKPYLYHVRVEKGNRIFVAEMTKDLFSIDASTLKECINATQPWEDTQDANWKVTEGPTVFKHKNQYYLVYSANDFRNPDYAIGYAVSKSPVGPWKKSTTNPIFSRKDAGINGTGHGDLFRDETGQMFYVLHTHFSNEKVAPRKTGLIKLTFTKNDPGVLIAVPGTLRLLQTQK